MAFWKKFYKSKYTGREIDAAVAKAGTVPVVTEADAGKALVVDDDGKIVTGAVGSKYVKTSIPNTNLTTLLTQTMIFISGLTDGDAKYKTFNVNKNDNESGYNDLKSAVDFCVAHKNDHVIVDIGGTNTMLITVENIREEVTGTWITFAPEEIGTRTIGISKLYADPNEGQESVTFIVYAQKYTSAD